MTIVAKDVEWGEPIHVAGGTVYWYDRLKNNFTFILRMNINYAMIQQFCSEVCPLENSCICASRQLKNVSSNTVSGKIGN